MKDSEIDLFVQALLLPPPCGFTEEERKEILNWLKSSSVFIQAAEERIIPKNSA